VQARCTQGTRPCGARSGGGPTLAPPGNGCKTLVRSTQGELSARPAPMALNCTGKGRRSSPPCNRAEHQSCPPARLFPDWPDQGIYLAVVIQLFLPGSTSACHRCIPRVARLCCTRAHLKKPAAWVGYGTEPGLVMGHHVPTWRCARRVLPLYLVMDIFQPP